ncbi:hypothetical protein [Halorarius litoreus]|uniref:hypothetical protein n=1 Tax=Halorarius litoreus TaxID=2962676 RepID=UPI0020CEE1F6|nr:hypothetical protein [Halorarius litoreus]
MTESASADTAVPKEYGGLFGAFPYAFRQSESRLFKLYAVVGGLLAALLSLAFLSAFALAIAQSVGLAAGGTASFVRAFVVFVGFLVVAPLVAPVLFVARHHRRVGNDPRYDRALAAAGFAFAVSLYLAVVASMPPTFVLDGETVSRPPPSGLFAPLIAVLYAIPAVAAPAIPAVVAVAGYLVHRAMR